MRDIHSANNWGIKTNHIDIDVTSLVKRKDQVVKTVTDDVRDALRQHNVDFIEGEAEVLEGLKVQVDQTIYTAKDIILATGTKAIRTTNRRARQSTLKLIHFSTWNNCRNACDYWWRRYCLGNSLINGDLDVDVTILEKGDSILSSEIKRNT